MAQTYVLGGIAAAATLAFFVLAAVSRKRGCEAEETGIMKFAVLAGDLIAGCGVLKAGQSSRVRTLLKALNPAQDPALLSRTYYAQKTGKLLLLVLAGLHLSWVLSLSAHRDSILQNGRELIRGGYEKDEDEVALVITDEDGKSRTFSHALLGRTYAKGKLSEMADALSLQLPELILKNNPDPSHIYSDLTLKSSYEDFPFLVDWESSDYTRIDSDGTVYNRELNEPAEVVLTATLSYRDFEQEKSISVMLYPAVLSMTEQETEEVEHLLEREDEKQQEQEIFLLPDTIRGEAVSYAIEGEGGSWMVIPLVLGLSILLFFLQDYDLSRKLEEQKKKIESVYPRFVGKFVLLYGAGMSIRRILERLAEDPGLEELGLHLQLLLRDLHNGILEQTAIEAFGRRLGSPLYIKFSGLLIGNLKKGNTELLRMLKEEADAAFVLRRNQARKKGEEAGTKLLFPMILMLGVVMAVIMLPAFMSF